MQRGKENEGSAFIGASGSSSYVGRLQRRQELEKLRESVAGKSVSERLMRKSLSLRPGNKNLPQPRASYNSQSSLLPTVPQSPLSSLIASEALLDDAAEKLQRELAGYDKKIEELRSHASSIKPPIPLPPKHVAAPEKVVEAAVVTSVEDHHSIVRNVTAATGQGCKEIITASAESAKTGTVSTRRKAGAAAASLPAWKTRAHKVPRTESSCMLQLNAKKHRDVTIRITFTDAATVPALLCFEHAPTPTAAFVLLGQVPLQAKSMKQLRHVFRLGDTTVVDKYLRITALGHISKQHGGAHSVSHLLVTGTEVVVAAVDGAGAGLSEPMRAIEGMESASSGAAEEVEVDVSLDSAQLIEKLRAEGRKTAAASAAAAVLIEQRRAKTSSTSLLSSKASQNGIHMKKESAAAAAAPAPRPRSRQRQQDGLRLPETVNVRSSSVADAIRATSATEVGDLSRSIKGGKEQQPRDQSLSVWDRLYRCSQEDKTASSSIDVSKSAKQFTAAPSQHVCAQGLRASTVTPIAPSQDRVQKVAPPPGLVPLQRATLVSSLLAKLKMSPEQAKHALLRVLDGAETPVDEYTPSLTNMQQLENILTCLPTEEERRGLLQYNGSWEGLSPGERFMLSVLHIPALQERLHAVMFLHGFNARAAVVAASAKTMTTACTEIGESVLLHTVMTTVLRIGNFLNVGNQNGPAAGFQVDALLKLRDVKSSRARSKTLLHVLARELSKQHPDEKNGCLSSELPTCQAASRISLDELRNELGALAEGIEQAQRAAGKEGGASPGGHLNALLAVAIERLQAVNSAVMEADAAFIELKTFINGKPSTMDEPAAFFSLMAKFCTQLESASAENAVVDNEAAKKESAVKRPSSARADSSTSSSGGGGAAAAAHRGRRTSLSKEEEERAAETPPRRDHVLETIRAYSCLTASQRKALLTEQGAKERLVTHGITHRHSIAATGAPISSGLMSMAESSASRRPSAATTSVSKSGIGAGTAQKQAAVRSSAPIISLAALMSHHAPPPPVVQQQQQQQQSNSSGLLPTVVEGSGENENDDEVSSSSVGGCGADSGSFSGSPVAPSSAVSLKQHDEEQDKNLVDDDVFVLSSPVARMVASSKTLLESVVHHRTSFQVQKKPSTTGKSAGKETAAAPVVVLPVPRIEREEEDQCGSPQSAAVTPRSDASNSDISIGSMLSAGGGGGGQEDEEGETTASAFSSPVTLHPISASADGSALPTSPDPTPQVSWGMKTAGGGVAATADAEKERDYNSSTPESDVLQCSASLQPVPGHNPQVWRSSASSLDPAPEMGDDIAGRATGSTTTTTTTPMTSAGYYSSGALSLENPVASVPTSLQYHEYDGTTRRHDASLDDDAGSPQKPPQQRIDEDEEEEKAEEELGYNSEWVQRGVGESDDQHIPAAAAAVYADQHRPVQKQQQQQEKVRGSKRVSFSLPASPQASINSGSSSKDYKRRQLHHHRHQEEPQQAGDYFEEEDDDHTIDSSEGFVESPSSGVSPSPLPSPPVPHHHHHEQHEQPLRLSRERLSVPGLDMDLAKQLVKNASQVRRSLHHHSDVNHTSINGSRHHSSIATTTVQQQQSLALTVADDVQDDDDDDGNAAAASAALSPSGTDTGSIMSVHEQASLVLSKALAAQLRRSLPGLPGVPADTLPALPNNLSPSNIDQLLSAIIANAGNTPSGPLARGIRQGDVDLFNTADAEELRAAAAQRAAASAACNQEHRGLLEPIVPAPLGMGVRASKMVAQGISPATLRHSLEAHLRQLQYRSSSNVDTSTALIEHSNGSGRALPAFSLPVPPAPAPSVVTAAAAFSRGQGGGGGMNDASVVVNKESTHYTGGGGAMNSGEWQQEQQSTRRSRASSARDVNSSLAQERMMKWSSYPRGADA